MRSVVDRMDVMRHVTVLEQNTDVIFMCPLLKLKSISKGTLLNWNKVAKFQVIATA